jgi:hypothetical protein
MDLTVPCPRPSRLAEIGDLSQVSPGFLLYLTWLETKKTGQKRKYHYQI